MSSHVQAQDLRQSSPFFVEGPQKRPNLNVLNVHQRVSGGIALVSMTVNTAILARPAVGLTGRGGPPIMRRSIEFACAFCSKG